MTKSGRYYLDPPMEKDNVRGKAKVLAEEDTDEEDDQFLRQLKRTQASVTLRGRNHSRALFVTAEVGGWKVPSVMIDDGAYDDSKRNVIGVFKTMVKVGPIETEVEFTMVDIPMTFPYCWVESGSILRWSPLYTPPKDQDPAPRWCNHRQC
ncbi:hypothetical protein GH714_012074 [Hevea brasiliensis]|uniref:Uncharacterized protein n=1 Tax=Hevea brasiliensis TaxID=3981 RepID=A0A6A6L9E8_HEVBR|nr:hypothetical protein GH714_012074 [Hevea brasiliensis]